MRVPIEEVPAELRRRAAQHLESIRGTPMGRGADRAGLADDACPVHRPDIDGVAYWEFEVDLRGVGRPVVTPNLRLRDGGIPFGSRGLFERLRERPIDLRRALGPESGFILVSTGPHDFPIPHWSLEAEPVSRRLEAAAKERDGEVARVVKLDALGYGAEDEQGGFVAQVGQLPLPLKGLPDDLEEARGRITGVRSRAATRSKSDDDIDEGQGRERSRRGEDDIRVSFATDAVDGEGPEALWKEVTANYSEHFGPLLEHLRRNAAHAWEVDRLATEFGEGIVAGTPHRVALLEDDVRANVTGEGAGVVRTRMLDRGEAPPAIELLVEEMPVDREIGFELHLEGGSGLREELRFFVVSPDTPTNQRPGSGRGDFDQDGDER